MQTVLLLIDSIWILVFLGIVLRESGEFGNRGSKAWRNVFLILTLLAGGGLLLCAIPTTDRNNIRVDLVLVLGFLPVYPLVVLAYLASGRKRNKHH